MDSELGIRIWRIEVPRYPSGIVLRAKQTAALLQLPLRV